MKFGSEECEKFVGLCFVFNEICFVCFFCFEYSVVIFCGSDSFRGFDFVFLYEGKFCDMFICEVFFFCGLSVIGDCFDDIVKMFKVCSGVIVGCEVEVEKDYIEVLDWGF